MKLIHSTFITALTILLPMGTLWAQEKSPVIPVGSLSAFPTIVQTGTHPTLTWNVTVPEAVNDIVEIEGSGTIVPKRDLVMDVRILGAGVTSGSGSTFKFVPTETQISYNGESYGRIFYGTNHDVNSNDIVHSQVVLENSAVNFGARYYYNNEWGTLYSSTNSSQVVALKNGDTPPTTTPMHEAPTIETFIKPYLGNNGKIKIGPRDIIYLMELTHSNPDHSGFDLQDMAILVTFYDEVSNNGHGNNVDGVDSSNPGNSKEGEDTDPTVDDEIGSGSGDSGGKGGKKRGRRKK